MAAEIVHQPRQLVVAAALQERGDRPLIADLIAEPLAPCRSALKHQSGIKLVRTIIDPLAQYFAARFGKRRLLKRAVFEQHYVPTEIAEQVLIALPKSLADDGIQALPVVIDNPPAIAQPLLPALEHRFEDIAFIELGVAKKRNHAAFPPRETPTVGAHIILGQRRKQSLGHAKSDRTRGKVDVIGIFGA